MNVVLIGLRGTGKSTCGRLLAERLQWSFVDTDEEVEKGAGKTIKALFEAGGEPLFRKLESEAVRAAALRARAVIATGGGAILDNGNVEALRANGFVVHFTASPQELWRRVQDDASTAARRPALLTDAGLDGLQELQRLMLARSAAYSTARHAEVTVEGRSPAEIVEALLLLLKAHGVCTS